jgi:hypothetical protein
MRHVSIGLIIAAAIVASTAARGQTPMHRTDAVSERLNQEELGRVNGQVSPMPTPPAPPIQPLAAAESPFDGTYRLVSATRVNDTFMNRGGDTGYCTDRTAGPLTIMQWQARYTTETGRDLTGPVGRRGEIDMRFVAPDGSASLYITGAIDGTGIARVRQRGNRCSYDFTWQKQH